MRLCDLLKLDGFPLCVIGSGGKTSLILALAAELSERGTVVVATTTHIYPPPDMPCLDSPNERELCAAIRHNHCLALGTLGHDGKLCVPQIPLELLPRHADYVLIEADGSRGLPMKAHLPHEPVLPAFSHRTLCVLGASGFGKPIATVAHRADIYAKLAGVTVDFPVTPKIAASVLSAETAFDMLFINQCDKPSDYVLTRQTAELISVPVYAGALQKGEYLRLR